MSATEASSSYLYQLRHSLAEHAGHSWELIRRCSTWVLLIPVVAVFSTIGKIYPWIWLYESPPWFQQMGAYLLGIAFVAGVTCWVLRGEFFHRWLICVIACLLCRALQLSGTRTGVAIVLLILVWQGSVRFAQLRPYLDNRILASLLCSGMLCYAFPLLLPQSPAFWMHLGQYGVWQRRISAILPFVGQVLLLLSVLGSEILWRCGKISAATELVLPLSASREVDSVAPESQRKAA